MKKIIFVYLLMLCVFITGCDKKNETFSLEEKYYKKSDFVLVNNSEFQNLIKDKESFITFIYQPMCSASSAFEEVLKDFLDENEITIYKMSFDDMKKTKLENKIKYYPSFVIYKEGKLVDFLDAGREEHTKYYKSSNDFNDWLRGYVKLN